MNRASTKKQLLKINRILKKTVLESLLEHPIVLYISCQPHPNLRIGTKRMLPRHRAKEIVLPFDSKSMRDLKFKDHYLSCKLHLESWKEVKIPYESISRIFDKGSQVIMQWITIPASLNAVSEPKGSRNTLKTRKKRLASLRIVKESGKIATTAIGAKSDLSTKKQLAKARLESDSRVISLADFRKC